MAGEDWSLIKVVDQICLCMQKTLSLFEKSTTFFNQHFISHNELEYLLNFIYLPVIHVIIQCI